MLENSTSKLALAASAAALVCSIAVADASPVAPGDTVTLAGTTARDNPALAGTIVHDELRKFAISSAHGVLVEGVLQDRVIRNASGALVFAPRIVEIANPGGVAWIIHVKATGYGGVATDVDYRTDALGDVGPRAVTRSAGAGDELAFHHDPALIAPPDAGYPLAILTDATEMAPTGSITIYAQNDFGADVYSTTLDGTMAPAIPCAPVISASVQTDGPWPRLRRPAHIANGGLFITAASRGHWVGDGADETTMWTFDFRSDPGYREFHAARPALASALLTLTLTPGSRGVLNDGVRIPGLGTRLITSTELRRTPVGETRTVVLELLDFYPSGAIVDDLVRYGAGRMFAVYYDDATVERAQLDLVPACE